MKGRTNNPGGRPALPPEQKADRRKVGLLPREWTDLYGAARVPDGTSPTRAVRALLRLVRAGASVEVGP